MCGASEAQLEVEGVRDFFFKADPGEFSFRRCGACASIWLHARPVGQRLVQAYGSYYTHQTDGAGPRHDGVVGVLRQAFINSRFGRSSGFLAGLGVALARLMGRDHVGLEHFYRFAPKAPAKVLDYGCGGGDYLLRLSPLGYDLHGAEYDPFLLAHLAERGIAVEDVAAIAEDRWENEFDHISLSHVLEHVPNPRELLARLFRWLRPGGSLFIEVPNANATGLALFGPVWRGLEAPRHFFLPSRAALVAAVADTGFVSLRQVVRTSNRQLLWDMSLEHVPEAQRDAITAAVMAAPPETTENAEFLTFVVKKPTGH
jgi:2-polyprenyl-3-methyl-5-hydroxy-6-metoxy-1,4-benzoquinol methylase